MATPINRKVARAELASIFTTDLTGPSNPVQKVFSYDRRDFEGESPVVLVLSAGSGRSPWGIGTVKYKNDFQFAVLSFVRDAIPAQSWTEQNVEDALDDVEAAIAKSVMENRNHPGFWLNLMFDGEPSSVMNGKMSGEPYRIEVFTLIAEVYDA